LYAERQEVLVLAAQRECAGRLEVSPNATGLHLVGWLPEGADDREVSRRAAAYGVEARPLSTYRVRPGGRGGLVLGYAGYDLSRIRRAMRLLGQALVDS
jgi:GntR family transcriptional regulator/MocR family aminotransferase